MTCNICNKNQATVHLTEIIDGAMSELHLCEECARQKSAQMEQQFGLSDLLAGMAEFSKPPKENETVAVKCSNCGLTYKDFKKAGRLGCGVCYMEFKKYLGPLLKRIHGSSEHAGKIPQGSPAAARPSPVRRKNDLQELKLRLQKAVESEAFEEAAKIRDQIKEAEKKEPGKKENQGAE